MSIVVSEYPFWTMVVRLRQFEGWRCLWRVPVAALAYAAVPLIFVGATVLAAYIAGNDFNLGTAVISAIVVVGATGFLAPRLARLRVYRKIIANRLWTWERHNPTTEVQILLPSSEATAARAALCRARFNPLVYSVNVGNPPSDAPELNVKIAVHEPEAWLQSKSDEDRILRIAGVLERVGLRARIGGLDIYPTSERA